MSEQTVFVVDDDKMARDSIIGLIQSMGTTAKEFESAEAFLDFYDGQPGCLVTDYRMPGMNGLELQETLIERGLVLPIIFVTAFACTPLTVQAIKNGAVTMLDKPFDDDTLWQAIRTALSQDEAYRDRSEAEQEAKRRLESLNQKETAVLDLLLEGSSNKAMAQALSVSLRTIENRRRKIFLKMGVDSVAELVAMVLRVRYAPQIGLPASFSSESGAVGTVPVQ